MAAEDGERCTLEVEREILEQPSKRQTDENAGKVRLSKQEVKQDNRKNAAEERKFPGEIHRTDAGTAFPCCLSIRQDDLMK
jgi:hypothetical protein